MATMIPAEMGAGSVNRPEEKVFEMLRDHTPASWIGLHHVGIPRHPTKPLAEIDFLLISERGVFGLEVKGGSVSRRDGIWRAGKRELKESPFQQVGSATAALRNEVADLHPFLLGYGCVFPDCQFDKKVGQEGVDELVFDGSDAEDDFVAFISRLSAYWSAKYPRQKALGANDIRTVSEVLRPDFEMVESIMPSVRTVRKGLFAFTDEQQRAVDGLRETEQVVVKGGAGTGKTLLAANEALRLAGEGKQTLFTCFSKRLAEHLEARVTDKNLRVAHLDDLMTELIETAGTKSLIPSDASDDDRFDLFRPLAAIEAASLLGRESSFDAVVIDEGQDLLTQPRLDVIDVLLAGGLSSGIWRVFWDPQQAIFASGADTNLGLVLRSGAHPVSFPLSINCRNTREIADRVEFLSGVSTDSIAFVEGPEAIDVEWDSEKSQRAAIRDCVIGWREAGMPVESIAILSPRKFENSVASTQLNLGAPVRDVSRSPIEGDPSHFAFSTIHSFKGLEADAVLLVDIEDLDSDIARSLMYVGASRARVLLGVMRNEVTSPTFTARVVKRAVSQNGTAADRFTEL